MDGPLAWISFMDAPSSDFIHEWHGPRSLVGIYYIVNLKYQLMLFMDGHLHGCHLWMTFYRVLQVAHPYFLIENSMFYAKVSIIK